MTEVNFTRDIRKFVNKDASFFENTLSKIDYFSRPPEGAVAVICEKTMCDPEVEELMRFFAHTCGCGSQI